MKWSYGVTTVPSRFKDLLPRTLKSLAGAGFENPRLFIDGCKPEDIPQALRRYEITSHFPNLRTFGNWMTALWELYAREPKAERYAIFQDDFVTYKNLRQYLEDCDYPKRGYWNLYTFPQNEKNTSGWYLSNQLGKGAVALVFNNEAVRTILQSQHMVNRPLDPKRGWQTIDGGIVTGFKQAGWQEWVHNPSLVLHTGEVSSMGHKPYEDTNIFKGEEFDALNLIRTPTVKINPVPRSRERIGIVGYNCNTGLGELNRQFAQYADASLWLVKPHPNVLTNPAHDNVDTMVCPQGNPNTIKKFCDRVDTILFAEQPYYNELIDIAKTLKKRLVCVPMMEWMPPGAKGWPQFVDLFICPTHHCYEQFQHVVPCVEFPWPIDTQRFSFKQRGPTCESFLYIAGHGGFKGRKGIDVVLAALKLWPEFPLTVISQVKEKWPKLPNLQVIPAAETNSDLYADCDVLVYPPSVDGLGLQPMEAMACGMPVISTNGLPWNEIPAIGKIAARQTRRTVRRPVDWYIPDAQSLVDNCKRLLGQDIAEESLRCRQWAEARSWDNLASDFASIVRTGNPVTIK